MPTPATRPAVAARTGTARLVVAAAAFLAYSPFIFTIPELFAVAGALAVITALTGWARSPAGLRAVLVADLMVACSAVGVLGGLPAPAVTALFLAALLLAWAATRRIPALGPPATWWRRGRMTRGLAWAVVATVVVSAAALTAWVLAFRPSAPPYLSGLGHLPPWLLVVGVIGFALVNAVLEEGLFRGVFLTELTATWGVVPALVLQAAAFGLAHLHGFPSGPLGACMAGAWGLALGVMRVRSGGILAPYLAHMCADATIGILAVTLLR